MCNVMERVKLERQIKSLQNRVLELECELENVPEWTPYPPVGSMERPSPQGWIDEADLEKMTYGYRLKGSGLCAQTLPNTNSMEPFMDVGHTVILKTNIDKSKLQVGDIVAHNRGTVLVLHPIIEITTDSSGERLFKFQGNNCSAPDPEIVKDNRIYGALVAVLYTK